MPHIDEQEIEAHADAMSKALTEDGGLSEDDEMNYRILIRDCINHSGCGKYIDEHIGIDRVYERAAKAQIAAATISLDPDDVVGAVCAAITAYADEYLKSTELDR